MYEFILAEIDFFSRGVNFLRRSILTSSRRYRNALTFSETAKFRRSFGLSRDNRKFTESILILLGFLMNEDQTTEVSESEASVSVPETEISAIVSEMGELPATDEEAITEFTATMAVESKKDKFGTVFDPEIHRVENGEPVLTAKGRFSKIRGRKKKTLNLPAGETGNVVLPENDNTASAIMFTDMYVGAGAAIFGSDFIPEGYSSSQERKSQNLYDLMVDSFRKVLDKYGVVEVHPVMQLLTVLGMHTASVVKQPEAKPKAAALTAYLKSKFGGIISRFTNRKRTKNAHVDTRTDKHGKNNTGTETSDGATENK